MALLNESENNLLSMDSLLINDDTSCYDLVEILNKIVSILKTEINNAIKVEHQLQNKYEWYSTVADSLTYKLEALRNLAHGVDEYKIKTFVDQISASWIFANIQVSRAYSKIQLASRVLPGVPLSLILKKVKKEATAAKVALQIGEIIYSEDYVLKGYNLFEEITEHARRLEKYDIKVQQYLAMSKLIPHLKKLVYKLDKFATNTTLLRPRNGESSNLNVFPVVSQLLTGELLGYEPVNTNSILFENAVKKPILITKNKRRWDAPWIVSKITRTSL